MPKISSSLFDIVSVDLSNGQLTPNNNTPLLTQALSGEVMLGIYICVFMFHNFIIFLFALTKFF